MMHLRIVSPTGRTDEIVKVLECAPSVLNIVGAPVELWVKFIEAAGC